MKKVISLILAISIAVLAVAQPQGGKRPQNGKQKFEKIKAERVAFITSEVGLSAKDAEAFWPIYNKADAEQHELMKAEKKAYAELNKALAEGQGNVDALLDAYIKAKKENVNVHFGYVKEYKKAIGSEKTAKFFTSDEKFRRKQIGKLRGKGQHGPQGRPGANGERPRKDKSQKD